TVVCHEGGGRARSLETYAVLVDSRNVARNGVATTQMQGAVAARHGRRDGFWWRRAAEYRLEPTDLPLRRSRRRCFLCNWRPRLAKHDPSGAAMEQCTSIKRQIGMPANTACLLLLAAGDQPPLQAQPGHFQTSRLSAVVRNLRRFAGL